VHEIRERDIEAYLIRRVKATDGIVRKVTWQGHRGAPDRMVSWPAHKGGRFPVFVELKAPGESLDDHQKLEHDILLANNVSVIVIDSFEGVDELVARRGL
jgi:hypothetical protein